MPPGAPVFTLKNSPKFSKTGLKFSKSGRNSQKLEAHQPQIHPPAVYGVDDAAFYGVGAVDDAGEKPRGGFDGTREERKGATMAYENIKTYADLARTAGDMVLANEMAKRPLELVSGDCAPWDEVFQWYIISDPSFIMEHTDELVFHDEELDLYILGVTHFGTSWDYVPAPDIR